MNKINYSLVLSAFIIFLGITQTIYAFEATPSTQTKTEVGENKSALESAQVMNQLSDLKRSKETVSQVSKSGLIIPQRSKQPLVSQELISGNVSRKYSPPLQAVQVVKIHRVIPTYKVLPNIPKVQKKDKDDKEIKSSDGSGNAAPAESAPVNKEKPRRWF